jgi:hypothetical protein
VELNSSLYIDLGLIAVLRFSKFPQRPIPTFPGSGLFWSDNEGGGVIGRAGGGLFGGGTNWKKQVHILMCYSY